MLCWQGLILLVKSIPRLPVHPGTPRVPRGINKATLLAPGLSISLLLFNPQTRYNSLVSVYTDIHSFYNNKSLLRQQHTDKMKYSTAILAIAATTVYAQVSTVEDVISKAESGVNALDAAGKAFNGDVAAVKSKGDSLVATLKSGKTTVDGLKDGSIKLTDAVALAGPVQSLAKAGTQLRNDFKAKISEIEKAKACSTVRTELGDINDASQALIKSITSKVETDAQSTAATLAKQITDVLSQAQADFSEQNCKDGSSSGSSAPSSGASQTSAAPSGTGAAPSGSAPSSAAAPSGSGEPCHVCEGNGGNGTAPSNPGTSAPVTAGASFLAPAGALAVAIAAALL